MSLADTLPIYVAQVERGLALHVPAAQTRPSRLHTAMRYSVEAGGKRLRPVLVLAAAELTGASGDRALPAAVAVECLHTYSLIHDDLPCMDNDDLRRGRPTAHRAFDEATALLAGDALLTHAFAILATAYTAEPILSHALIAELAEAAGSRRLIGGQMEDLLAEKAAHATADDLRFIHLNKTAALIEACLVIGGWLGATAVSPQTPASPDLLERLRQVGRHLGLAFQIMDDILDATSDSATLGKTAGKDARADKTTFVKIHGLETSRRLAAEETEAALAAIPTGPGNPEFLRELVASLTRRKS